MNLIAPDGARGTGETNGLARMEEWIQRLSTNGGNYIRVWLRSPFWDMEHERSGTFDEAKAQRVDALLGMARRYGIRVKLTIEHFRTLDGEGRQRWAHKPLHHVSQGGTATNLADFFTGQPSRDQFKRKLAWYANRYGDDPTIFGWELWNEVNAVATSADHYLPWTEVMLQELHRLFPRNLAMQSLGSFDSGRVRDLYRRHSLLPGNDVAQVHRYLDLGSSLEVCHGPVDVLKGKRTVLIWCRDSQNTWRTELEQGTPPEVLGGIELDLTSISGNSQRSPARIYDPWKDRWSIADSQGNTLTLPAFARSVVVRLELNR